MRWLITGLIFGLGFAFAAMIVGDPFASGADSSYQLGRIVGRAVFPLLFGAVVAAIFGKFKPGSPGALHRRTNWIAAIALALATFGSLAQIAR